MKNGFIFKTDKESYEYCVSIIDKMVELFGITKEEALGRMNKTWGNLELVGDDDLIYHEDEDYWANNIYYGKNSRWWTNPDGLKPLPYP